MNDDEIMLTTYIDKSGESHYVPLAEYVKLQQQIEEANEIIKSLRHGCISTNDHNIIEAYIAKYWEKK